MFGQLFIALTLALYGVATPVVVRDSHVTIPVARRFMSHRLKGTTLPQVNRARARALKSKVRTSKVQPAASAAAPVNDPVTNVVDAYIAQVCFNTTISQLHSYVATGLGWQPCQNLFVERPYSLDSY